jgi:hypothetical protein
MADPILKARAERLFRPPADEAKPDAASDYKAKQDAEREKMARLRAARLAKEKRNKDER